MGMSGQWHWTNSESEYTDDNEAALALLLEVGALQKDTDGKIVMSNGDWVEAYALGATRLLEGKLKVRKWENPRRRFYDVVADVHGSYDDIDFDF